MTQTNNNRMVLALIAGIPLTMILAASWLWYFVVHGDLDLVGAIGTANRGELVQPPRQIDEVAMYQPGGAPQRYADFEPRWTLVIPGSQRVCDAACENTLYVTRQIHVAMGKEFNRIRRLYASEVPVADTRLGVAELSDGRPAPTDFAALLAGEHRGLRPLRLAPGGFDALFPESRLDGSIWYLVDPAGWVMMSYNSDIHYRDVIADLKFLLKNSGG